jgi:hypothetical protein
VLYSGASLSIVNNVKSVNRPRVCSCNVTAPLCVGDPILVTIIWISVIIPHRSSFEDRCCSICRLLDLVYQARRSLCALFVVFWTWSIRPDEVCVLYLSSFGPGLSGQTKFVCSICRLLDLVYQARRSLCALFVVFWTWSIRPDEVCVWLCCFSFWWFFWLLWSRPGLSLVSPWSALIDQPSFIFDFQLNFLIVFQLTNSPCYYIVISILYVLWSSNLSLFCDQVTSRTFHSMILNGIVRQYMLCDQVTPRTFHSMIPDGIVRHYICFVIK